VQGERLARVALATDYQRLEFVRILRWQRDLPEALSPEIVGPTQPEDAELSPNPEGATMSPPDEAVPVAAADGPRPVPRPADRGGN
jgi:hypothetical protein